MVGEDGLFSGMRLEACSLSVLQSLSRQLFQGGKQLPHTNPDKQGLTFLEHGLDAIWDISAQTSHVTLNTHTDLTHNPPIITALTGIKELMQCCQAEMSNQDGFAYYEDVMIRGR